MQERNPPAAFHAARADETVEGSQRLSGCGGMATTLCTHARRDITRRWHRVESRDWAGPAARLVDEAEPAGVGDGLGTAGRAQLGVNVADVFLYRVQGHHELLGDLTVTPSGGDQPQHLQFPLGHVFDQPAYPRCWSLVRPCG